MAPLSAPELHQLATNLQAILSSTRYASTTLDQLTGGTTSFVFHATLSSPLLLTDQDGDQRMEESVIIKHAAPFASCHTDFLIDAGRAKYEALMLSALQSFYPRVSGIDIRVPKSYFYDEVERVQVIQYIPNAAPLHKSLHRLGKEQAERLGHALGTWLAGFHAWVDDLERRDLKAQVKQNEEVVELKWKVTWGQGTQVLERLGDVLGEEDWKVWDATRAAAREDPEGEEGRGLVHGDFWAGNILVPDTLSAENGIGELSLHIIDFEFSHFASRATDLGQFLGDLLERYYIAASPPSSIQPLIAGFLAGYGPFSEELKWRTVANVGVHVVNWWSRGPPGRGDVSTETRERGVKLVKRGVGFVKGGRERVCSAFLDTPLAPLFEPEYV